MVRKQGFDGIGEGRTYFQHNYIDAIKLAVPSLYEDTDVSVYGAENEILYSMLGKIIKTIDEIDYLVSVSSYDKSSLQEHFILRNNKTNITPYFFNSKIVKAFGVQAKDYTNVDDWRDFVSGTILPNIRLNSPTELFVSGASALDAAVTTASAAHSYLLENLSWLYLLNTAGPSGGIDPSASVQDAIVSSLYFGSSIAEAEGVGLFYRYLWNNRDVSGDFSSYLPLEYRSASADVVSSIYLSGTQQRDRIDRLVGVWYNESDVESTTLDDYLDLYLNTGSFTHKQQAAGPFSKFLKALSYAFYDVNSVVDDIGDLISIEKCPPQFLQFLASLIGWKLLTGDVDRWRAQLRHAIFLYKQKGTRKCLEDAISLVFPDSGFNPATSGSLKESWECFLPRQIYYLIATESKALADPGYRASNSIANTIGIIGGDDEILWDVDNHDNNYRFATDYVLSKVQEATDSIILNGKVFSLATWDPDNADFKGFYHRDHSGIVVPPWENDRFYDNCRIKKEVLDTVSAVLGATRENHGLEVSADILQDFYTFVSSNSLESTFIEGHNRRWKYYTPSSTIPPNLSSIIADGNSRSMSYLDNWSSKSSLVTSEIIISDYEKFVFDGIKIPVGDVMITLQDIFRQFAPFHVIVKLIAKDSFAEHYASSDSDETLCLLVTIDSAPAWEDPDFDQSLMTSWVTSGVSAGSYPSTSSFDYSSLTVTDIPRTTHRRRNFKYNVPAARYRRDGISMPVPAIFGSTSATPFQDNSGLSGLSGINTPETVLLGYNYSAGRYWSTTGTASAIYDASNDLGLRGLRLMFGEEPRVRSKDDVSASFYGIDVSNTHAVRVIHSDVSSGCVHPIYRNGLKGYRKTMIDSAMRRGETAEQSVVVSEDGLRNFRFGSGFTRAFYDTQRIFGGVIQSNITSDGMRGAMRRLGSGGLGFSDHAMGPLVYNHDFMAVGRFPQDDAESLPAGVGGVDTNEDYPHWKFVAANKEAFTNNYNNYAGTPILVEAPIFSLSGTEPHYPQVVGRSVPSDEFGTPAPNSKPFTNSYRIYPTLLDGVEIWGRDRIQNYETPFTSFVVFNTKEAGDHMVDAKLVNQAWVPRVKAGENSVSFITSSTNSDFPEGEAETFIRFSAKKGRDYIKLANFNYPIKGIDPLSNTDALSLFKGATLHDTNRDGTWNGAGWGTELGSISVSAHPYQVSGSILDRTNYLYASVSGEGEDNNADSARITIPGITGLIPGNSYDLKVTSYKDHDSAASAGYIRIVNTSKSHSWNGATWKNNTTSYYDLSGGFGEFLTHTSSITPSATHTPNDEYTVHVYPRGPLSGTIAADSVGWVSSVGNVFFSSIELLDSSGNAGVNALSPDHEYEITIRARRGRNDGVSPNTDNPVMGVRVMTDVLPINFDPESDSNSFNFEMYSFNFNDSKWVPFPMTDVNHSYGFKRLDFNQWFSPDKMLNSDGDLIDDPDWFITKIRFNTHNNKIDTGAVGDVLRREGENLHNVNTPYHIDICKLSRNSETFLTVDEVSVQDLTYSKVIGEYSNYDLNNIYTHFKTMVDGKASRDARDSSGTYQTSGGSRDYYLDIYGGVSSIGANTSSILDDASGTLYEVEDD